MISPHVAAIFWSHVEKLPGDGCWIWKASTKKGYGQIIIDGKNLTAHRVAWELVYGAPPPPLLRHWKCDNKRCVRVEFGETSHVIPGTQTDNMRDMTSRGRHWLQVAPERTPIKNLSAESRRRGVETRQERFNGTAPYFSGENHWTRLHPEKRRLSEDQVRLIRRRSAAGETSQAIGRDFDVSPRMVRMVAQGKRYAWVRA